MSRTKKVTLNSNPAKFFVSFNGKDGKIGCKKQGENDFSDLPTPFRFVVIDADCKKIGGKSSQKKDAKTYKSNLVHPGYCEAVYHVGSDKDGGVLASGPWATIRESAAIAKARMTQLIYAIGEIDGHVEIVCISVHGRSMAAWINICKDADPYGNNVFEVSGFEKQGDEKENVESLVPVFAALPIEPESDILTAAKEADENMVQPYFAAYFKTDKTPLVSDQQESESADIDPLPFD